MDTQLVLVLGAMPTDEESVKGTRAIFEALRIRQFSLLLFGRDLLPLAQEIHIDHRVYTNHGFSNFPLWGMAAGFVLQSPTAMIIFPGAEDTVAIAAMAIAHNKHGEQPYPIALVGWSRVQSHGILRTFALHDTTSWAKVFVLRDFVAESLVQFLFPSAVTASH